MAVQLRSPIGPIAFVSTFLVSIFSAIGPTGIAHAADCLTAPGPSAPPNSHWYYRTDRTQQRKCWFLRSDNGPSQGQAQGQAQEQAQGQVQEQAQEQVQEQAVQTTQSVPAAEPYSLARFKNFMAHRGSGNLSDKDVERLYAQFLAWRRDPANKHSAQ
jgi:hypothetical protein